MVRRTTRILSVILGALVAAVTIVLGALVYELTQGPISLSFLTPYLEPSLNDNDLGADVSLNDTILTWNRDTQSLDLQLLDVEIHDANGELLAAFPRLEMGLSGLALTKGMLAPTFVAVSKLSVRVIRNEDGTLSLAIITPRDDRTEERDETDLLAQLLDAPDRSQPSGYLTRMTIRDAELIYEDRRAGAIWPVEVAELTVNRDEQGVAVELNGHVIGASPRDRWPVDFSAGYSRAFDLVTAEISVEQITLGQIAERIEGMGDLAGFDIPVRGAILTSYQLADGPRKFSFSFDIGQGRIDAPNMFDTPITVSSGHVDARFDWIAKQFDLEKLTLTNGAFAMAAKGQVGLKDGGADIDMVGKFDTLSIDDLKSYWPKGAGEGARVWVVENMKGGLIYDTDFAVKIPAMALSGEEEMEKDAIDVRFKLMDGSASVLGELPWLTEAEAEGHLTAHTFKLDIQKAMAGPNRLSEGSFFVRDLRERGGDSDVELVLRGQLEDVLTMIDQEPLVLPSKLGLVPQQFSGETATRLKMVVPLRKGAEMSELQFAVVSNLRKVDLPDFVPGMEMRDAEFVLRSDGRTLSAKGKLSINGVEALASWSENFNALPNQPNSVFRGSLVADTPDREVLGFDLYPWLDGPTPLNLEITMRGGTVGYVDIDADLRNAKLSVAPLGWVKPAGALSRLSLRFVPGGNGKLDFSRVSLQGTDHKAEGSFVLSGSGGLERIAMTELQIANIADGSIQLAPRPDGVIGGRVEGRLLRLANPLTDPNPDLSEPRADESSDADQSTIPDMDVSLGFEQMRVGDDLLLKNVTGNLEAKGGRVDSLSVDSYLDDGKPVRIKLTPTGPQTRALKVLTENAGAVLQGLGLIDNARDGTMTLGVNVTESGDGTLAYEGGLQAEGLRIVKLPALGAILNLSSFTGIANTLQGDGLMFETVEIPFRTRPNGIRIDDAKAVGPSVGIHFRGLVGDDGTIDIGGTVAPAYTLNSVIGYVPIIGKLLVGGEGEGLIAVNFTAKGPADDIDIGVNPLSALTPGFLRGIFGTPGGKDKNKAAEPIQGDEEPAPTPAPPPPAEKALSGDPELQKLPDGPSLPRP